MYIYFFLQEEKRLFINESSWHDCRTSYFIVSGITSEDTTFIFTSICSVNEEQPIVK